ncbi:MAG: hypothetical protein CL942_00190 [Desulfovibrio sp.]|nr:hypothetical protein [Desulfovibrio sp.]|tara:strand:- start:6974 stop:8191 length:1218 start_codon:yes stop_codon:yes gene_type:complete
MSKRLSALTLSLFVLLTTTVAVAARTPKTIVLSPHVLQTAKERTLQRDPEIMEAYQQLLIDADNALDAPVESVVLKPTPPPKGDLHDYWSLAPDWWPNDKAFHSIPYVHRPGERNPEADSDRFDYARMERGTRHAITLAQAWYMTGNEEYAGKGTALIWAWLCDSATRMEPNLQFAHMRPGKRAGRWIASPTGITETRLLISIADAARLLEPSRAWSAAVSNKFEAWFEDYVDWLQRSPQGRQVSAMEDANGTWFDAQLTVFAMLIGKDNLARSIVGTVTPRRIEWLIQPDGSMPHVMSQADPLEATLLNLEAFHTLAAAGESLGIDLWHWRSGAGVPLKDALDHAMTRLEQNTELTEDEKNFHLLRLSPLLHRAAVVYKDDRYLDFLHALPQELRTRDRAQLFH